MKKLDTTKICLILIFLTVLIFTSICIWLFYKTGGEPAVLIGAFFTLMTGECGFMWRLKDAKIKKEMKENSDADREIALCSDDNFSSDKPLD